MTFLSAASRELVALAAAVEAGGAAIADGGALTGQQMCALQRFDLLGQQLRGLAEMLELYGGGPVPTGSPLECQAAFWATIHTPASAESVA